MPVLHSLVGKTFWRLTVISESHREPKVGIWWNCKCRCGNEIKRPTYVITRTSKQSCGKCNDQEKYPNEYAIYHAMIYRCYNSSAQYYERYGGRGITVCESWRSDFLNFLADMGRKPANYSLDRINNDGNYEPTNCKWSSIEEQNATKTQRNGRYNPKLAAKYGRVLASDKFPS